MRKSPVKVQESRVKKGEVTAFLSLIFLLLISFSVSIMEAASIQMAKNYRRTDMDRAIESVFAEYRKELLEEFDVFAFDAGYETGDYNEEKIEERLSYYGASGMEQEIQRIRFLTDSSGREFYEQAIRYVQHKYGLDFLNQYAGLPSVWNRQEEEAQEYQGEEQNAWEELDQELLENEGTLPVENNPLSNIEALKQKSLLDLIMPQGRGVSSKRIVKEEMVSVRKLQQGYGSFEDVSEEGNQSKLLFGEYILEHFSAAIEEDVVSSAEEETNLQESGHALEYEIEYILEGKESDKDNLEAVAKKLLVMRFAPNYGCILGSAGMRAQAEAMAFTLCTAAALPVLTEAVTQVLLLGWAFGESIMDLRSLLKGSRVPLVKTEESWQLSLSALLTLGTEEDTQEGRDMADGLSYKEYLRILIFLKEKEHLSMRALDIVELCLRKEKGLAWFRADTCVCKVEIKSSCHLRRGISYQFRTYYGYK